MARFTPGERFGKYTLLEPIGKGGMAEVFLARQAGVEGFEKFIVIKRIRPHLSEDHSFVNMFLNEAKLAAQLNHSNIVQIYDLGCIGKSYFIAMEYVAGRDMSAVMPKAKSAAIQFPFEYALKVASNVCEGLYYAHNKTDSRGNALHIVHRDVSPENIRIGWNGIVKILDFGIAKAATQINETRAGEIKGKLGYMSPEQVMGKTLDHRSDIFSLGVVTYEWITGLRLFSGDNDLAIMNNIIEGRIYPPSYFKDDVPEEVENIIMKALEKDRDKRYQSAFDMQFDIETFLASHEFTPSNIHLSNFIRQLFKDEIDAEQERLKSYSNLSPLDEPTLLEEEEVLVDDLVELSPEGVPTNPSVRIPQAPQLTPTTLGGRSYSGGGNSDLTLRFNGPLARKISMLADVHSITAEQLVSDLLSGYFKYIPEEKL